MTRSGAVRVLPSSRPAPRTWVSAPARPVEVSRVVDPEERPPAGQVVRVGRAWSAAVPDAVPDAARWTGWLALALGEALIGRRPAARLVGWVSAEVLAGLRRRQRLRPVDPVSPRTVLLSGRVQHPVEGTAEASAVLRCGPRLLVLAFRLEVEGTGWVCTALEAAFTPGAASRRSRERPAAAAPAPDAGTR